VRAEPIRVGWSELADLPDWGVSRLPVKLDTGARTSALHAEDVKLLSGGRVRFRVVVHREHRDRHVRVTARVTRRSRVRSSNGHYTTRLFVRTTLRLAGIERPIEISLVDRSEMSFRMILGRTALAGAFLVDSGHRRLGSARRGAADRASAKRDALPR
jgi:hypothetical protein